MFSIANKPVIIAFCGKSCVGKDTTAKWIANFIDNISLIEQNCKLVVSDTTRPPREGEVDGVNYNFISKEQFEQNVKRGKYLEWAIFRNWYYGTNKESICSDINIGVFNAKGIQSLFKLREKYLIIPVYLHAPLKVRLKRSINREHKFKLEYLRRLIADYIDFKEFEDILLRFPYNFTMSHKTPKIDLIYTLIDNNILTVSDKSIEP